MSSYSDGVIELLQDLSACGTLPMAMIRGSADQFGGQRTLQSALTQSLVRTEIVEGYFGRSDYLVMITSKGRTVLEEHGEDWSDIALDGMLLASESRKSEQTIAKESLYRAKKFGEIFLLMRSLGAVPQLPIMPVEPLPYGTIQYITAGCCRRLLWQERPEILKIGYCQGGVLVSDGAAWVVNILAPRKVWNKRDEETAAAAFTGLVRTMFGNVSEINLLFIGENMNDATQVKPKGKRTSSVEAEVYGRFSRVCFVESSDQGRDILRNLLDPDGQRAARKRWIPDLLTPDRSHAIFDGITPEGRPVLLGHTCDYQKLYAIGKYASEKPLVRCLPGQGRTLRRLVQNAAEVREDLAPMTDAPAVPAPV